MNRPLPWIKPAYIPLPFVTGFSPGACDTIDQTLLNTGPGDETVIYTITPGVGGCIGDSVQYIVTVIPGDSVSVLITATGDSVCEGTPVTFTAIPVNGGATPVYQWQVNGINIGSNDPLFTYYPASGDLVACTLTSSEPCTSNNPASSNPVIMTVVEAPTVTFTPCFDTITTTNAAPIRLKGGIPLGGIYSGIGVISGSGSTGFMFDPGIAGYGIHEITYHYTNEAGCRDSSAIFVLNSQFSIFNCGSSLTDIRDNQVYPTIQIGSQCWFAANLNYGTEIPITTPQRDNCIAEKYSRPSSFVSHPSFYQWDELMCYDDTPGLQGFCPPGWHVPSEAEWGILFSNWTNNAFAGAPLKYSGYSGYNAFLTGAGFFNKGWWFEDFTTFFWSSTSHGQYKAWAHGLNEYNFSVSYYPGYRGNAFSVRCLKD